MISRTGIFLGGVAAALTVAIALALNGLAPATDTAPVAATRAVDTRAAAADPPQPTVQVDTVYLPAPVAPQQIVVHKVVKSSAGDGEHESEGGDD